MANPLEHADILRIVGYSKDSFEDAVRNGLDELTNPKRHHHHHPGYRFTSFEVVKLSGLIDHDTDPTTTDISRYAVTLDVTAVHTHDDDHDH